MTTIRPMIATDLDFVVSGWSSSYRTSDDAGFILMEHYADVMHQQIRSVLSRPTTRVLVAAEPDESLGAGRQFLYGFLVFHVETSNPYVYYCYVKRPYRRGRERHGLRLGHASALFEAAGIDPIRPFRYACRTPYCKQLALKIPFATRDQLAARYPEQHEQRTRTEAERPGPGAGEGRSATGR